MPTGRIWPSIKTIHIGHISMTSITTKKQPFFLKVLPLPKPFLFKVISRVGRYCVVIFESKQSETTATRPANTKTQQWLFPRVQMQYFELACRAVSQVNACVIAIAIWWTYVCGRDVSGNKEKENCYFHRFYLIAKICIFVYRYCRFARATTDLRKKINVT